MKDRGPVGRRTDQGEMHGEMFYPDANVSDNGRDSAWQGRW
jgi:hypothetical protein